jgi:cell division protease FtsH
MFIYFAMYSTAAAFAAAFSINNLPIPSLLEKIHGNEIRSLVFSPSLEYMFIKDIQDHTTLSFTAPIVSKEIYDECIKEHISTYFLPSYELFFLPIIGILFLRYFLFLRSTIAMNPMMNQFTQPGGFGGGDITPNGMFGTKTTNQYSIETIMNVTFAGYDDVIEECADIFKNNRTAYAAVGAKIPKGILLEGPPGNGKTYLAKYIAQKTNYSFISVSGSEFVNLFVGMGASNVRKLFDSARANTPCIIFIDEIDSIGKRRISSPQFSNDEKDQTLNQILTEMDGFKDTEGIFVMAATNRKELLDPALLRPGRFDRIIRLPLPDIISRRAILGEHAKIKRLEPTVDLSFIAEMTDGFSGAQLKNLLNEAAIFAARVGNTTITPQNIMDAIEKSTVGLIRKKDSRSRETRERVAIHELGHAFLCSYFSHYFDLKKVSIQSTYEGAGGYTLFQERRENGEGNDDGKLATKDFLKKRLIVAMGGKAAENIVYGNDFISIGATQDLKQANGIARQMIEQFGMGELLQPFYREGIDPNTGMGMDYSDRTKTLSDRESLLLVTEALCEAKQILKENDYKWLKLKERLMENTVLYGIDFNRL